MTQSEDIKAAVEVLRKGGVILYPTDTVWGIGCDPTCEAAVKRVFDIKKRADSKALILLAGSLPQLERTAEGIPEVAYQLIEFSDKPLTIVYDGAAPGAHIAPDLLADDGSVAVRITNEEFSKELCRVFGKPLVSTSANISGHPTPAYFDEISQEIIDAVDYVCSTGRNNRTPCRPSTVMRLSEDGSFKVLRP